MKVSRVDLLGGLKKPATRGAYLDVGGECWYVLASDDASKAIARPGAIPLECGVLQAFDASERTAGALAGRCSANALH